MRMIHLDGDKLRCRCPSGGELVALLEGRVSALGGGPAPFVLLDAVFTLELIHHGPNSFYRHVMRSPVLGLTRSVMLGPLGMQAEIERVAINGVSASLGLR